MNHFLVKRHLQQTFRNVSLILTDDKIQLHKNIMYLQSVMSIWEKHLERSKLHFVIRHKNDVWKPIKEKAGVMW